MKKAKKLSRLNAFERHKLRIAIKKLRYSSDFFGCLFTGRKATARFSCFNSLLSELQDRLGALNDIAVHEKLAAGIAASKSRGDPPKRAFAAGVVSGREQAEVQPLLISAAKLARKLAHARAFWT
jgi:triphosphatase